MLIPDLEYKSLNNELPYIAPAIPAPGIGISDPSPPPRVPPKPATKL